MLYCIRQPSCHALVSFCLFLMAAKQSFAGNAGPFIRAYLLPVATNQYQVVDTTYPIPAPEGYALSATLTPGELFPVSFVLRAGKALSGIGIKSSSLTGRTTIPASAVNIRLVKTWYSYNDGINIANFGKYLIPELLVYDDALVRTNLTTKISSLRATINGVTQYVDITTPTSLLPAGAIVNDATTLRNFSMAANTNKQVWLTIMVPVGTAAGNYNGTITVSVPGRPNTTLSLSLTVLPFTLSPPVVQQALYYRGTLSSSCSTLNSECKTRTQLQADLQDLMKHGVSYPSTYEVLANNSATVATDLSIRAALGFPKDRVYVVGDNIQANCALGDTVCVGNLTISWVSFLASQGWGQAYIYGFDEAQGSTFVSENTSFKTISADRGMVVTAIQDATTAVTTPTINNINQVNLEGDAVTPSVIANEHSITPGQKVYEYSNPFAGFANPQSERYGHGLLMIVQGYDGGMNYVFQDCGRWTGTDCWNTFSWGAYSGGGYATLVYAYPTTSRVVDTIEWEGHRVGYDDIRYASTLASVKGWTTAQLVTYLNSLNITTANPNTMASVRQTIINAILN